MDVKGSQKVFSKKKVGCLSQWGGDFSQRPRSYDPVSHGESGRASRPVTGL
jgi:hypothetical protein